MRGVILSLLLFTIVLVKGQNLETINNYILNANAESLTNHFSKTIDLSIIDQEGIYSQTQAKIILDDFFQEYPPAEYTVKHTGGNKNNTHFAIGKLVSKTKIFRTHILYSLIDNQLEIIELRFELEE